MHGNAWENVMSAPSRAACVNPEALRVIMSDKVGGGSTLYIEGKNNTGWFHRAAVLFFARGHKLESQA